MICYFCGDADCDCEGLTEFEHDDFLFDDMRTHADMRFIDATGNPDPYQDAMREKVGKTVQ